MNIYLNYSMIWKIKFIKVLSSGVVTSKITFTYFINFSKNARLYILEYFFFNQNVLPGRIFLF